VMSRRQRTLYGIDPPSRDAERREGARAAGTRAERRGAVRAERARGQIEFLACGPAGYPFSRRA
jgi:hypothetical protein